MPTAQESYNNWNGAAAPPPPPKKPPVQQSVPAYVGPNGDGTLANQPPAAPLPPPNYNQPPPPAAPAPTFAANGTQNYSPTQSPFGMDQSAPGVGEQYWDQNQQRWQDQPQLDWASTQLTGMQDPGFGEVFNQNNMGSFAAPGQGEQYWDSVSGSFNTKGQYSGPNLANEAYQRTSGALPGSLQPSFDSYYDRARDKAAGAANSQASARGAYGSSAALNNVGNVITDIETQRANRASDFALRDSQNQMNWHDLAGRQGRSADQSSMEAFGQNLEGMRTFGDMAFRAGEEGLERDRFASDTAFGIQDAEEGRINSGIDNALGIDSNNLDRTNAGFNAAGGAQTLRDNRIQGMVDNTNDFSASMIDFYENQFDGIFGGDERARDEAIAASLGMSIDDYNANKNNQERIMRDGKAVADIATGSSK